MKKQNEALNKRKKAKELENPRDQFMVISKRDMKKRGWKQL